MKLKNDWKQILRNAWSVRLIVLAAALTGLEIGLPLYSEEMPRGLFAALSGVVTILALVARLLVQRSVENDADEK